MINACIQMFSEMGSLITILLSVVIVMFSVEITLLVIAKKQLNEIKKRIETEKLK